MKINEEIPIWAVALAFIAWLVPVLLSANSFSCLDSRPMCGTDDLMLMAFLSIGFLGPAYIVIKITAE